MANSLGRMFSILHKNEVLYISSKLKDYNINFAQYTILNALYNEENINQEKLGKILSINKGNIAKSLKGLMSEGYIKRLDDKKDKRAYRIYVTEKGNSVKDIIINLKKEWNTSLVLGMNKSDIDTFYSLINKVKENSEINKK